MRRVKFPHAPALLTGLQGARKSAYLVSSVIVPALKAGKFVITNMPLNLSAILTHYKMPCPPRIWIRDGHELCHALPGIDRGRLRPSVFDDSVVVVDEAGLILRASDKMVLPLVGRVADCLALCRHRKISFWFAAQVPEQVARAVAQLCQYHYYIVNVGRRTGLPSRNSRVAIFFGYMLSFMLSNRRKYPPADSFDFTPRKGVYSFYESVELGDTDRLNFSFGKITVAILFLFVGLPLLWYLVIMYGVNSGLAPGEVAPPPVSVPSDGSFEASPDWDAFGVFCAGDDCSQLIVEKR